VGIAVIYWVLWLNRNDAVFQNKIDNSYLQVVFKRAYWIRQQSLSSKEEERRTMKDGCRQLEGMALHLFGSLWKQRRRIGM